MFKKCYSNIKYLQKTKYNTYSGVKNINWSDTIPYIPPIDSGYVLKVYNGNTFIIASKLPYDELSLYRFSINLSGINYNEKINKTEGDIKMEQMVKDEIEKLVLNKIVTLKNIDIEKYGKIFADVYIGDLYLNKYLLEKKMVMPYNTNKKNNWNYYIDFM